MPIVLSPESEAAVRALVADGSFPTPEAAIDEAVGLLRERAELRRLIQEGIDSGPGIPGETVFAKLRARAAQIDAAVATR